MIDPAGRRVTDAQNDPLAGGSAPVQFSVGGQLGSKINHLPALNGSIGRVISFARRQNFGAVETGFCVNVFNDHTLREFDFCERNFRGCGPGTKRGELHAPETRGDRLRAECNRARGRTAPAKRKRLQRAERLAVIGNLNLAAAFGNARPAGNFDRARGKRFLKFQLGKLWLAAFGDWQTNEGFGITVRKFVARRLVATRGCDGRKIFHAHDFASGRGKREHGNVTVKTEGHGRLRERGMEIRRAGHAHLAGHDALHGVGHRVPRAAATRPAGAVFHAEFEAQPVRLRHGEFEILAPFGTHKIHRAARDAAVHVHDGRAAEADLLHRFEVGGDAGLGDVAIHPMPPGLRLGGIRRIEKPRFQRIS